ncbi:MAG: DUF2207 domain-containing protein [Thermoleophilia bacterium]|nr:DUF2207 domain-containing protein [Thermoleophilia bacterium]
MTERITYDFAGDFSGAYRDIPLGAGESVDALSVEEDGAAFTPGGCTELGCTSPPGMFGVERTGDRVRVVWHYRASFEQRTFVVSYRFTGVATAYDDVVDVFLQVWGDQWEQSLGRLTVRVRGPGPPLRSWAHPAYVRGTVRTQADTVVVVEAVEVPPGQFVEARVLFPRLALVSTQGARVETGDALERIEAEELEDAERTERDRDRVRSVLDHPLRSLLLLLGLGLLPGLAAATGVWAAYGRERSTGYDQQYEHEPPGDLAPALVAPLLGQRTSAGAPEFTATLFDLVRRGRYRAEPRTTERSTWAGLRSEQISDLELSAGEEVPETPWERQVTEVVDDALGGAPGLLSELSESIAERRTTNAKRFREFQQEVASEIGRRGWFENRGRWLLGAGAASLLAVGALLFFLGVDGAAPGELRWGTLVRVGLGVALGLNGIVLGAAALRTPVGRRRARAAQADAERWTAFRRFLADFPRLEEAPPASLELWERYLVYGIAFGLAERVLRAAQLHMPAELHDQSAIYWIDSGGSLGSGPTSFGIADLVSSLGSSLAPPASSGGGGGGFSGAGGGGGGGGGGGAW